MTSVTNENLYPVFHLQSRPDFGAAVTAAVVRQNNEAGTASTEAVIIKKALHGSLANYKVPKRVQFVNDLPRNAMGKVPKNLLRQQFT